MLNYFRRPAWLGMVLGLLACDSPTAIDWDGQPLLRTEGTDFQVVHHDPVGMSVTIPYSYVNQTGNRVLLANCRGDVSPSLERKQGENWMTAWGPVVLLCAGAPIQIGPGAEYHDTLHLVAAEFGGNGRPQFAFEDVEGVYRLRWDPAYWDNTESGDGLPLKFRVSNEFFLRDP